MFKESVLSGACPALWESKTVQVEKGGCSMIELPEGLISGVKPSASAKAFLATEQRIPGLGNGCLQDILFRAGLNPRKKLEDWPDRDGDKVFHAIKDVMADMTEQGGRDTEKDLLGNAGGYRTLMSRNTLGRGCPACGQEVVKEAYLGGTVYYCPVCQPLDSGR